MPIIGALTKVQLLDFSEILALTIVAMATTYFVVKPLLYAFFQRLPARADGLAFPPLQQISPIAKEIAAFHIDSNVIAGRLVDPIFLPNFSQ